MRARRDGTATPHRGRVPPIVWLTAGVHAQRAERDRRRHGGVADLAAGRLCGAAAPARRSCAPLQNPDGRAAAPRANAAGFDLNRDWFARRSPRRGDARAARALPPHGARRPARAGGRHVLLPAERRPGPSRGPGRRGGRSPPCSAPRCGGRSTAPGAARELGTYDLFYMGYADTVRHDAVRRGRHDVRAGRRVAVRRARGRAHAGGRRCCARAPAMPRRSSGAGAPSGRRPGPRAPAEHLQPNARLGSGGAPASRCRAGPSTPTCCAPTCTARTPPRSPPGSARPASASAASHAPPALPAFHAYGASGGRARTLPAGTWVVPLAQTRKHWVEALLGQDAYPPVARFYDVCPGRTRCSWGSRAAGANARCPPAP